MPAVLCGVGLLEPITTYLTEELSLLTRIPVEFEGELGLEGLVAVATGVHITSDESLRQNCLGFFITSETPMIRLHCVDFVVTV